MKLLPLVLVALILTGCDDDTAGSYQAGQYNRLDLSYQELVNYHPDCNRADEQLAELTELQDRKNFLLDPDELSDFDRKYNSRLKATIWWYAYSCEQK